MSFYDGHRVFEMKGTQQDLSVRLKHYYHQTDIRWLTLKESLIKNYHITTTSHYYSDKTKMYIMS